MNDNSSEFLQQAPLKWERLEDGFYPTHLTPVEHVEIGSTIANPENPSHGISAEEVMKRGETFYLTPLGLLRTHGDAQALRKIAEERKGKYLQGWLPIIEPDPFLLEKGYEQRLLLMDLQDGVSTIPPQLQIQVVDHLNRIIKDEEIFKRIKITPELSNYFVIDPFNAESLAKGILTISIKKQ